MKKVIVIFGPTGVGKSDLGVQLAQEIGGEIISADSMQIYKNLDIGTAKITKQEMKGIPHYMIDMIDTNKEYSVGQFAEQVRKIIDAIFSKNKIPIIVGGTGLFINSLVNNYDFSNVGKDEEIRKKYETLASQYGNQYVYDILKSKDPNRAEQLHPNDIKRIIRALEILENTQKNECKCVKNDKKYEFLLFALNLDREKLYKRINLRVDKMFELGLENEMKRLVKSGINRQNQSMQAIGYKEMFGYLDGTRTLNETKELIKQHTRNYAKRQLTFMRGMKNLIWIEKDENSLKNIKKEIEKNGCK